MDTSGSWGCGACWQSEWLQLQWSGMLQEAHISMKRLTSVVLAAGVWGRHWSASGVRVLLDNTATVAAINNQTSRIEQSAHLLRCLAFLSAQFQCTLSQNTSRGATMHGRMHYPGTISSYSSLYLHRSATFLQQFPWRCYSY